MNNSIPEWRGEDLTNKHILILKEQGIGDQIMFASCFSDIISLAGHCTIETDSRLVDLFSRSFPQATVVAESAHRHISPDFHIYLNSLSTILKTKIKDFPEHQRYLIPDPDPDQVNFWQQRIKKTGKGLKVGICWRSAFINEERVVRYTCLDEWEPVFNASGIEFINLQYGNCEAEILEAEEQYGIHIHRWSDLDLKDDLESVAALMSVLDLVVSVSTMVVELAGALNVPVWQFSPGSEWTTLDESRRYRPFPIKIFQKADLEDAWDNVMHQVVDLLAKWK